MGGDRALHRADEARRLRRRLRPAHLFRRRADVPTAAAARGARGGRHGGGVLSHLFARARRAAALMDIAAGLLHGFAVALQPANVLWCFVGVFLGTIVGIMPGLGPPATIAMLL